MKRMHEETHVRFKGGTVSACRSWPSHARIEKRTALEMALALDELNIYKDSLEITYPNEEEEGANTDEGTL